MRLLKILASCTRSFVYEKALGVMAFDIEMSPEMPQFQT